MNVVTIPKKMVQNDDLVVIPRRECDAFLDLQKTIKRKFEEEKDTDLAVRIYKKEKKQGTLKVINSLADLN